MDSRGTLRDAVGIALLALLPACRQQLTCDGSCPTLTYDLRAMNDSAVTWTFRDLASEASASFGPPPPAVDGCSFDFTGKGIYLNSRGTQGEETWDLGYFSLRCGGGGHGNFDVVAQWPRDLRDLAVGTWQVPTAQSSVGADYFAGTATGGAVKTDCPVANLNGVVMTVTVESATGGRAPYPKGVTDDFSRDLRVDFDTASVVPTTSWTPPAPCTVAVTVQASLHLVQTAADYVYDPNASCPCE